MSMNEIVTSRKEDLDQIDDEIETYRDGLVSNTFDKDNYKSAERAKGTGLQGYIRGPNNKNAAMKSQNYKNIAQTP